VHERTGRTRRDGVAVQACERDELEDEAANIVRRGCRGTAKGRKEYPSLPSSQTKSFRSWSADHRLVQSQRTALGDTYC
jgi:hypothetical protein